MTDRRTESGPEAPAGSNSEVELTILLAEYSSLKSEQQQRIDRRDHLVLGTLAAIVAAFAAAAKLPDALLAVPAVAAILGWTHLIIDQKIYTAGKYLREQMRPRLSALAGASVLGWENAHRSDTRRAQRNAIHQVVNLVTFPGTAVVATLAYLATAHPPVVGWVGAAFLFAAAVFLGVQQALYARDMRRDH